MWFSLGKKSFFVDVKYTSIVVLFIPTYGRCPLRARRNAHLSEAQLPISGSW